MTTDHNAAAAKAAKAFADATTFDAAIDAHKAVMEWISDDVAEDSDLDAAADTVIRNVTGVDADERLRELLQ